MQVNLGSERGPLSGSQTASFLLFPSVAGEGRELWGRVVSFIRTLVPFIRLHPDDSTLYGRPHLLIPSTQDLHGEWRAGRGGHEHAV